jgi:endonuclease YncB( thermonuclease family)
MKHIFCFAIAALASHASAAPAGYFDLRPGVAIESGETWIQDGKRFRLYGIQACLRGTFYTTANGKRMDCGDSSIAVLAAYIKDTSPVCAPVALSGNVTFVSCFAIVGQDRLDLGTLLIASGFAFASLNSQGKPYQMSYLVTEQTAKERREGLWRFADVQHPAIILSRQANAGVQK